MNPVNQLQELMVAQKEKLPLYTFESSGNPTDIKFICSVIASHVTGVGEAGSKKAAKYSAAENALTQLGFDVSSMCSKKPLPLGTDNENVSQIVFKTLIEDFSENENYIGRLNEFASTHKVTYPSYEMPLFAENGQFKIICKFQDLESIGLAANKKKAKQIASFKMMLNFNPNNTPSGDVPTSSCDGQIPPEEQIPLGIIVKPPIEEQILSGDIHPSTPDLKPVPEPEIED